MRVTMFQSAQGDCLLLSDTGDRTRILVDGGMPAAYSTHVAPQLTKFRKLKKKNIDLVYVSHVDQDHIGGILRMLDDEVDWRVHQHQKSNGNSSHKPPKSPRPPLISAIWHNAFHEQLKDNAGAIEEALAASAPILSASEIEDVREAGKAQAGLATSIAEAIKVSRRIGARQLNIPLNTQADGRLMMLRKGQAPITIGEFQISIIGPTADYLTLLRNEWDKWLRSSKQKLAAIRKAARADEENLGTSDLERLFLLMQWEAEAFGDPESVTPPNLASLTLLVEEGGTSILLTGDARWDQIVHGLERTGHLEPNGHMNVDIVKVPHHGSENNVVETRLLDRVIGKHYVFCGNGHSGNPEIEVVELMAKHRLNAPGKFKFWFNCSEQALADYPKGAKHMRKVEAKVKALASKSGGRMAFRFLTTGSSLRVG